MERKRKRFTKEIKEKGIPIAEAGAEVIFNDVVLKSPFISNPFISRLKGRAFLEQCLAYNLYFDDLTQKWKPLSDITISTVKTLARYYPSDPTPPTVLSDLPLRITNKHELRTKDLDLLAKQVEILAKQVELLTAQTLTNTKIDSAITTLTSIKSVVERSGIIETVLFNETESTGTKTITFINPLNRVINSVILMYSGVTNVNGFNMYQSLEDSDEAVVWTHAGNIIMDKIYVINVDSCTGIRITYNKSVAGVSNYCVNLLDTTSLDEVLV